MVITKEALTNTNIEILQQAGFSRLPDQWSILQIKDILAAERGISVGVMYPGQHDPLGIPLIKGGDMSGNRINQNPDFFISVEKHHEYRRTELSGGEILLSLVGEIGLCAIVPSSMAGWNAARAIAVIRLKDPSDAPYVRLCLMSKPLRHLMDVWATTTVQATLNLKEIRELPLPWPPKAVRDNIAANIGFIDRKIDVNREMNETLMGLAKAIFRDWFIDFGPVRYHKSELLEKISLSKFPSKFDDNGIPETWTVGTLKNVATLNPESWNKTSAPKEIKYIDLSNTKWGTIERTERYEWQDAPSRALRVLRPGDTIVGTVRPGNGSFAFVSVDGMTGSTGFAVLRPKSRRDREFVYLAATSKENIARLTQLADGGAYPAVRPEVVASTEIVVPTSSIMELFSKLTCPLFERMEANKIENGILCDMRDQLLPKLLSGELTFENI